MPLQALPSVNHPIPTSAHAADPRDSISWSRLVRRTTAHVQQSRARSPIGALLPSSTHWCLAHRCLSLMQWAFQRRPGLSLSRQHSRFSSIRLIGRTLERCSHEIGRRDATLLTFSGVGRMRLYHLCFRQEADCTGDVGQICPGLGLGYCSRIHDISYS